MPRRARAIPLEFPITRIIGSLAPTDAQSDILLAARRPHAEQCARPRAGCDRVAPRAIILVLPRHPYLRAGRGRKLGLRRARSTESPSFHRPAESKPLSHKRLLFLRARF